MNKNLNNETPPSLHRTIHRLRYSAPWDVLPVFGSEGIQLFKGGTTILKFLLQ